MGSLQSKLAEFQESAQQGYSLAMESYNKMKSALAEEKESLREADRQQGNIDRLENDKRFSQQLREMEKLERDTINEVGSNLEKLNRQMSNFTIVVYGRTMAGKSTLMEILTHGDGRSIGQGGQRTTRDVRSYEWNGLKILDTPGTCSFGGEKDDKTAFEAAKTGDLVLFLLTSDAPQPHEAERLAELKKLGKPVLGVVNVKSAINSEPGTAKRKIDLKKIEKQINDRSSLNELVNQFKAFAPRYDVDFDDIKFVNTHLQAEYFYQREGDTELHKLSNFSAVENFIQDKVSQDGQFTRFKTFVDNVAKPMQDAIATLYSHSAGTVVGWESYTGKIRQLDDWYGDKDRGFVKNLQERYNTFYDQLSTQLNNKINYVVNNYYDSEYAGDHWKDAVGEVNISQQCQDFIRKVGNEVTQRLRRLSDELNQDAKYSGASFKLPSISMDSITDFQSGIMTIAPALAFIPAIGWAGAAIIGIGAWLFGDSKEEKIRKAKQELREKLEESRDEILYNVGNSVVDIINEKIHGDQIWGFRNTLFKMRDMLAKLAYAQNRIADTINDKYGDLNFNLFAEARKHTHGSSYLDRVRVSRIVGNEFLVFATSKMSANECNELSNLLGGEKICSFKVSDENYWDDVTNISQRNILNNEFEWENFYKGQQGNMHLIRIPKYVNVSDYKIQIVQQLFSDPVVRY